jgi:hypothetical protein
MVTYLILPRLQETCYLFMQLSLQPHSQASGIAALLTRVSAAEDDIRNLKDIHHILPEHRSKNKGIRSSLTEASTHNQVKRIGAPHFMGGNGIHPIEHISAGNSILDEALQRLTAHVNSLLPHAITSISSCPGAHKVQKPSLEVIVKGLSAHVGALEAFVEDMSGCDMPSPFQSKAIQPSQSQSALNIPLDAPRMRTQRHDLSDVHITDLGSAGSTCEDGMQLTERKCASSSEGSGIPLKPASYSSPCSQLAALSKKLSYLHYCLNNTSATENVSHAIFVNDYVDNMNAVPAWAQGLQHQLSYAEECLAMHATLLQDIQDRMPHLEAAAQCTEKSASTTRRPAQVCHFKRYIMAQALPSSNIACLSLTECVWARNSQFLL